ncbi:MAG: molecular chaperone HtpG [Alphaproteobacteria bacterium]|jgi:molecular chaperone HtpG|nr:molecular chaperone HtpG [Alphaproteobacteria bacterium]
MTEQRMAFKAEVSRLLDIVVHSLYSEKEIFLRELISNASDACDKLRYEALTSPELLDGEDPDFRISIKTDAADRTISIIDNGIGMNRDELIDNLGTIAQSGTATFIEGLKEAQNGNITQIGQFGVGFYAAFMVAQMVEVTSCKAGTKEAWCWRSDGHGEFAIEESDEKQRGTCVKIYLKQGEDSFLNDERIKGIVKLYSDHIALPIYLNDVEEPLNQANALWLRNKSEITPEQYKEFYHHVAHAFDEPALTLHWRAEGKIEYSSLLFIPSTKPYDLFDPKRQHSVKLYVKRVFITDQAEGLIPSYLRFLRGVIDSEDLPLNVSREMLQNYPLLTKIRHGVTQRVLKELATYSKDAEAYEKFWDNFGAVMKEGVYEDVEHREALLELLRCHSTHDAQKHTSLADYVSRMKEGQEHIYYLNGDNHEALMRSPHLEGFKARGIEVLLLTETVDDFWPAAVGSYNGKSFQSITRAGQDLDKIAPIEKKDKKDEAEKQADEKSTDSLIALMKLTLGDKVKDVRTTDRLTDSPVCLASAEGDLDIHLERFLKQHNQIRTATVRILEINPSHPLIKKLGEKASQSGVDESLGDVISLLLEQARLMDGEPLSDPLTFARKMADIMSKAV